MKKTRRLLALLLAMAMMLALTVTAGAEEVTTTAAKSEITVIYTNDVHTYIDKTLSYATVSAMKQDYQKAGKQVLLVDAGDHIQGTAYGGMDEGKTIVQLMNAAGYDIATLGNHEFDYGMARALATVKEAEFPYVSCNFYHEKNGVAGDPVLESYKVFDMNGTKVAFVGITTPESFTKSTPAYFQDANGKYIYGIAAGKDGSALYAAVQKAIDAASKEADYVIALGHLGIDPSSKPWTSEEVIAHTTGLDAFIDGHSHSTVEGKQVKDKAGNTVVLTQTGTAFAAIGEMTIAADGTITTKLTKEYEGSDATVAALQKTWMDKVEGMLGEKIAETGIEFTINDAEGNRAVRKGATNLFDLNADAFYWYINEVANLDCDVAVMNGGGVRATIEAGDWTYKSCKTVNPFGNVLCLMKVPGQMILDALEFGAKDTPDAESGGFLSAAGLTYEIDSTVKYTGSQDDKGVWQAGPTGEYRVRNVKIYNKTTGTFEPLDVNKTYTLG
ncbi:MAG: bifunctional UDP-sugar hydrolase/5'-nucleotidase, partial [Dysosmobacter sp.]|nr:bifunctional UDP-sugar hydrolase/5'-nucleotidase [Dysosmobacter sp.]